MTGHATLPIERKYQLLLEISQRVRETLNLDEVLEHLLDVARLVVDYDAAGIFVLNRDLPPVTPGSRTYVIASAAERGFDRPSEERRDAVLTQGVGIIGHVIHTGECVIAADVRRDPHYVVGRHRTLSEVAIPIAQRDRTIGALNFESDAPGTYREEDLEVLRFFADVAAIAIERAMLHRRLMDRQRIEDQLHIAHEVQARLLPGAPPQPPGYDIAGVCIPTFEIGGDYFDHVELADGLLALVIADVSGKGIPAALSMSAFRSIVLAHTRMRLQPAEIAARLNELLPEATAEAAYVTCVYGLLDPRDGRLSYVNCGHNPPLLRRADGGIEQLETGGMPLGVFPDAHLEPGEARLMPGDALVFYTDGVVENTDPEEHDFFGIERLLDVLRTSGDRPARGVIDGIIEATRDFTASQAYPDDFTLMVVRRT
jgi:sigma-B regulation protein RsbU (phosphoserine phosphatase)